MDLETKYDLKELNEIDQSPKWRISSAGWECTRRFITGADRLDKEFYYSKLFPVIGTKIKTPTNTEIELNTIDFDDKNKNYLIIIMNYGGDSRKNGIPEFSINDGTLEKPIEEHKNYLTIWNYALISKNGVVATPTELIYFATAKTTFLTTELSKNYKWQKNDMPVEDGWIKVSIPTKPGVETYLVPAPVIQEITYFRKLDVLTQTFDFTTGVIKAPATPLAVKLDGKYLINSMSLRFDGKWWEANKSYQFADKWDIDIYEDKDAVT